MAQKLTANRLIDGIVLYWKGEGWIESFADAELFESEEAAKAALESARASVARNEVVNPYFVELKGERPLKEREIIRAAGPSVRTDLGKQAEPPTRSAAALRPPHQGEVKSFAAGDHDVSL